MGISSSSRYASETRSASGERPRHQTKVDLIVVQPLQGSSFVPETEIYLDGT